ncbi:MAG: histidine--tRNA ligase, partial [Bacteroidales bacterium]|nr:histidine--tRNA ligase [Bacteroidales bacterium]
MGNQRPAIPKGTRDFLPQEMIRRKYIFGVIEQTYQRYGFLPIETPAMELLSSLTGKYGDEGDKLLFRVLNSGDFLSEADDAMLQSRDIHRLASQISEKGLRYDLTVPFARFVVQHRNELTFPFRRYQIQPVWRADRPQKGRYREFFQCDGDVIGSDSLLNEAELVQIIDEVFTRLGIRVTIRLNNRKVLAGMAEAIGRIEKLIPLTVALDKLDKAGEDGVRGELIERGLSEDEVESILRMTRLEGGTSDRLDQLESLIGHTPQGQAGIAELKKVFAYLDGAVLLNEVQTDLTLARGLNYYTGTIIEVVALDHSIGSLCGGGRYDDLTGIFGLPGVSGVGISFGADRIYDVMEALKLFPDASVGHTRLLFINFGKEEERESMHWLRKVREAGIPAEIYPESAKLKKQMAYADALSIPFVAIIGEEERISGQVSLKDMHSG